MKIIKLNAIDSTNDYLKAIVKMEDVSNFTVVCAEFQSNGKGQITNKWHSEDGKNLLCSVLVKNVKLKLEDFFKLHVQVSLAIFSVLQEEIPDVKIKWPNDIMSRRKKIAGILIENTVKNEYINQSIIGIGINVNQLNFPVTLTDATSLKKIMGKEFDRDKLLHRLLNKLKTNLLNLENVNLDLYSKNLYQYLKPSMYKYAKNKSFLGKIIGITKQGKLVVELENETVEEYEFKEITFL